VNMIERGRQFVESLFKLAKKSDWNWRVCPYCGGYGNMNGSYTRRPWFMSGRVEMRIPRYLCTTCNKSWSRSDPRLVPGSWYAREVHRFGVDLYTHFGTSYRRAACLLRSLMGCQERWGLWYLLALRPRLRERCFFCASTLHRWRRRAGERARRGMRGQLEGVENSGQFATDGLWARLRRGVTKVLLTLVDTVTGVVWTTHVAEDENHAEAWEGLFRSAELAGLSLDDLEGIASDGSQGLYSFLRAKQSRVHHQRCVWHYWRSLAGDVAKVIAGYDEEAKDEMASHVNGLLHQIIDATSYESAEEALQRLRDDPATELLAKKVNGQLDRLLYHLHPVHEGLVRTSPEWLWRDFRLHLSRGRNHGCDDRLAEAGALWSVYRNFTPAQWRSEQKREYKNPGRSPLQVAGAKPGEISYLDALGV
jgi:hypothetical protein